MKKYVVNPTIMHNIVKDLKRDSYACKNVQFSKECSPKEQNYTIYSDDYQFLEAIGYYRTNAIIDDVLSFLKESQLKYPGEPPSELKYRYFEDHVKYNFVVPWKSFSFTMEKLVFVLSYLKRPKKIISVGINCGHTFAYFLSWLFYHKDQNPSCKAYGIEKNKRLADLAVKNLSHLSFNNEVEIICNNALNVLDDMESSSCDLAFLDTRTDIRILEKLYNKLKPGGWLLMHNASDPHFTKTIQPYLDFVRDKQYFSQSFLFPIDTKGIELSVKQCTKYE